MSTDIGKQIGLVHFNAIDNYAIDQTILINASLQFAENENINSITLTGNGTLDHVSNVDVNGTLTVSAGTLRGAGRTDANAAHTINGLLDIRTGHQFRSVGAGVMMPNKEVSIYSGGRWDILPGGSVNFQGSNQVTSFDLTGKLLNNGTITKTQDGVTDMKLEFENDGLLHVQDSARVTLYENGNHAGTFNLDAHSAVRLRNSTHTFLAGSEVIGAGELQLTDEATAVIEGNLDVGLIILEDDSILDMRVDGSVGVLELYDGSITGSGELSITDTIVFNGETNVQSDLNVGNRAYIHGGLTIAVLGQTNINAINEAVGSLENNGTITRTGGGSSKIELRTKNKGTMTISGDSGLELPADFQQESGQLIVDGTVIFGSSAKVDRGKVTGSGTIQSSPSAPACIGCINIDVVPARFSPGNSPGQLDVIGDLIFGDNAEFEVEIAGTGQGTTYDLLSVTGDVVLDGHLKVVLLNNFVPQLNDQFAVLTANSLLGQFAAQSLPDLDEGLFWSVRYGEDAVTLAVVDTIEGDFNANGSVDAADYVIWRKDFSHDENKYNQWAANFGATIENGGGGANALAENTTVPEPSCGLLLLSAAIFASLFQRRRGNITV